MLAAFALVWMLWLDTARCRAQEGPSVVVMASDAPEVEAALVGELAAVRLPATRAPAPPSFEPATLEAAATALGAEVLVALRRTERGLEVWVIDRVTDKLVLRVLSLEDEPRTAALQILELVRASFLEVRSVGFDTTSVPAAVSNLAASALPERVGAPRSRALMPFVRVGGAISLDPGGLSPGAHVEAEAALRFDIGLALSAWVLAPTSPLVVSGAEGIARTTIVAAGLGAHVHLLPSSSLLDVRLGARLGMLYFRVEGEASAPLESRTAEVGSGMLGLDVRAALWLVDWLALDLTITGSLALPRPTVVFVERTVASWGLPTFTGSLGLTAKIGG